MKLTYIFSLLVVTFLFICSPVDAQLNLGYQTPQSDILKLVDAPLPPGLDMNSKGTTAVLYYRRGYKSIAELSQQEVRLAGLRINPKTNINSRQRYSYMLKLLDVKAGKERPITGLPAEGQFSNFQWSGDELNLALTNTEETGVSLWVIDIAKASATRITEAVLNGNMGDIYQWLDNESLLVKILPDDREALIDNTTTIPTGPTISENEGKKAQNRTYQDLLKNPIDEGNFQNLALSELYKIDLSGKMTRWMQKDMYSDFSLSPDGQYVLLEVIHRPFSYLVPYYRFPTQTDLYTVGGAFVSVVQELPLIEDLPKGFMATHTYKRNIRWRSDKASTLSWVQALDGGDPANEVEFRDALYCQNVPLEGKEVLLAKTRNRYSYIDWGTDEMAIVHDRWFNDRNTKSYLINPSDPDSEAFILTDRSYQDNYSDPGDYVRTKNKWNQHVLDIQDDNIYLIGPGYGPEGVHPFVDELNLKTKQKTRLYQSNLSEKYERIRSPIDMRKGILLVSIESPSQFPNYYLRNIKTDRLQAITQFENPFASIQDVHKELVHYKREDGIDLSGTLYLPSGYDKGSGEKLPMLLWAYPIEFKDKSSAGQVTTSEYQFTYPSYGSPIFWVTRGYAVLDRAAFPIVGEGDKEPNDSFREQLVANGKAAIDAIDAMGYIDRTRVGVGGHSYGAFMTANLLSHSDLFAAGIARSGAYNRTLTPFGFQREERSYWEAPEVYNTMSPFMNAEKMKTPLLLIHGEADNNSGTYPMQSERYFNALKGLGATVRLVMLPKESHGYAARESILHMLWEQDQWLEKYVKNKGKDELQP